MFASAVSYYLNISYDFICRLCVTKVGGRSLCFFIKYGFQSFSQLLISWSAFEKTGMFFGALDSVRFSMEL